MLRRRAELVGCSLALAGCWTSAPQPGCPVDRNLALAHQRDVTAAEGCKDASGVAITTGAPIDLAPLHHLETIRGDLVIGPTVGIEQVALDELREVGGTVRIVDNGTLRSVFLPRLERAGRVVIDRNLSLTTVAMPRLAAVAGSVSVTNNHDLTVLDASSLVDISKGLVIADHPKLEHVLMPRLAHAETVTIDRVPKLPATVTGALLSASSQR